MITSVAIGNLGGDPQIKYLESGSSVTEFSLACRTGKDKAGKDETTWVECSVWGKRGEVIANYAQKGSKLSVSGSMKLEFYDGKDGTRKAKLKMTGSDFEFLGAKNEQQSNQSVEQHRADLGLDEPSGYVQADGSVTWSGDVQEPALDKIPF